LFASKNSIEKAYNPVLLVASISALNKTFSSGKWPDMVVWVVLKRQVLYFSLRIKCN
jgi:hypothetical protein